MINNYVKMALRNVRKNKVYSFINILGLTIGIAAWPVAYILMNKWLQDFSYKIKLNFETFILSGFIILFIAIATISVQIIKTAKANPIKSLKYE
jgi:putative ABC transport system permease protein